jgi:hypothetical protein
MIKKLIIIFIFSLGIIMFAGAQVRLDVNVSVPVYNGIQIEGGEGVGDFSDYAFVIPDLVLSYVIDADLIKVGLGARMITFLVESVIWPNAFVELNVDPLVLNASVGGGVFFYFGAVSGVEASSLIIPDISAYFKFNEWFQLGGGIVLFVGTEIFGVDILPYSIYVRARFSFSF